MRMVSASAIARSLIICRDDVILSSMHDLTHHTRLVTEISPTASHDRSGIQYHGSELDGTRDMIYDWMVAF